MTKAGHSQSLLRRRQEVLQRMAAIEAPRVLWLVVAIIVLFDAGYAAVGIIAPTGYYISDLLQASIEVGVAIALQRRWVRTAWAPTLVMSAVVANNAATTYQATIVGEGALGIIALFLAVSGAIVLEWRAFLIGAALCIGITGTTLYVTFPEVWVTWLITMITAAAVAGVILYGRERSAMGLAEAQETIERMATVDNLTNLSNRHGFADQVSHVIGHAHRSGKDFFVAFIDVTGLKRVNDVHGHAAGDLVLQQVADSLRRNSRAGELICRWGGDEFVLVGVGEHPDPEDLGRRLIDGIDLTGLERLWEPGLWVGAATGAADPRYLEDVIRRADEDMIRRRPASGTSR